MTKLTIRHCLASLLLLFLYQPANGQIKEITFGEIPTRRPGNGRVCRRSIG